LGKIKKTTHADWRLRATIICKKKKIKNNEIWVDGVIVIVYKTVIVFFALEISTFQFNDLQIFLSAGRKVYFTLMKIIVVYAFY